MISALDKLAAGIAVDVTDELLCDTTDDGVLDAALDWFDALLCTNGATVSESVIDISVELEAELCSADAAADEFPGGVFLPSDISVSI